MSEEKNPKPDYWWSLFHLKCPRCRRGDLFVHPHPYKKLNLNYMLEMHKECSVCKQVFELETGFWYGTGYVSYGITVAFSAFTFLFWWLTIGFSFDDNRLLYWVIANAVITILLQPFFMRVSRFIFLNFFVKYNENFDKEEGVRFT